MSVQERSDLILKFGQVLHENGQTTGETVEATESLGKALGLDAIVIPDWRDLQLEVKQGDSSYVSLALASPTGIDMDRVSAAMLGIGEVDFGKLPAAKETIEKISRRPPVPTWLFTLGAAGGAAALAVIFGVEHLFSVVLIMISAGAGAVLRRALGKYSGNLFLQPFVAALLAGFIGALAVIYNLSSSLRLIAVCPCLVLIPGPHILNGMLDLIRGRVNLAISRLVYAGFIIVAISVGVLLTLGLLQVSLPVDEAGRTVPLLVDVAAAGIAAWAYSVFYSTPIRLIIWPVVVGMLAHAVRYETLAAGGNVVMATLIASLVAGSILAPVARLRQMPFAAIGFAAVVSMLPGVYLIRLSSGILQLVNASTATSQVLISVGTNTATAIGIVLAITFGVVVPKLLFDYFVPYRLKP
jgi:uncharacterized membrane protein YjjP (DUF1212 family)